MNNAQDMSPDFVLMRLVSAAEYDRVDEDNLLTGSGVVSGFGKAALGHHGNNISSGFELDPTNPSAGPACQTNPSPHCSSQPESGTAVLDSGVMLTRPSLSDTPPPPDFAVAQRFEFPHTGGRGSRAQLMVFQNLLATGEGLEQPGYQTGENDTQNGSGTGVSNGSIADNSNYSISAQHQRLSSQRLQWHPVMQLTKVAVDGSDLPVGGGGLCHRHRLVTDTMDWPPLLDKSIQFGLLDPRKACAVTGTERHREDPVLSLARRLGELGQASEKLLKDGEMLRCSCQSILASAAAGMGPGEDPSETSDALLVLEGLGSSEMGELAMGGCTCPGPDAFKGEPGAQEGGPDTGQEGATTPMTMTMTTMTVAAGTATFSSSSLSGLMRQVQRLAGAGVGADACCDPQMCRAALPDTPNPSTALAPDASSSSSALSPEVPTAATPALAHPQPLDAPSPPTPTPAAHTPRSRPPTPKRIGSPMAVAAALGNGTIGGVCESQKSRGKSRKGSLKIRLSKLFRTRSSGTGVGGAGGSGGPSPLLDKRPSLASSTSSGGSLMDVWSSSSAEPDATSSRYDAGTVRPAALITADLLSQKSTSVARRVLLTQLTVLEKKVI